MDTKIFYLHLWLCVCKVYVLVFSSVICSGSLLCNGNYISPSGLTLGLGMRCASFDGDADRIVFYYLDQGKKLC